MPSCTAAFAGRCPFTSTSPRCAARCAGRGERPQAIAIVAMSMPTAASGRFDVRRMLLSQRRTGSRIGLQKPRRARAATASRIVMPQRFETAVAHIAIQQHRARWRCRCRCCSAPTRSNTASTTAKTVVAIVDETCDRQHPGSVRTALPGACAQVIGVGAAAGRGDARLGRGLLAGDPSAASMPAAHPRRRCCGADLHQRHDRSAQGRADPAAGADRQPERVRVQPELVSRTPLRRVLVSPADWAWTGGLMDALLPTLVLRPSRIVAATGAASTPHRAFELMRTPLASRTCVPVPDRAEGDDEGAAAARSIETPARAACRDERRRGGRRRGVRLVPRSSSASSVNEMFGQTEINYIVGNCGSFVRRRQGREHPGWPARPGSMGRPYPGHRVAVLDDDGTRVPARHARRRGAAPARRAWRRTTRCSSSATGRTTLRHARSSPVTPATAWCRTGDVAADG